jgi:CheY-like chemotaxis protein
MMSPKVVPHGPETILIVENDGRILKTILQMLIPEGYRLLQAHNPKTALQLGARHDYEINLLLTDVTLPGMYGWQLLELMKLDYPRLRVLYIAGECDDDIEEPGDASEPILHKPYRSDDLRRAVRKVIDAKYSSRSWVASFP